MHATGGGLRVRRPRRHCAYTQNQRSAGSAALARGIKPVTRFLRAYILCVRVCRRRRIPRVSHIGTTVSNNVESRVYTYVARYIVRTCIDFELGNRVFLAGLCMYGRSR